MSEEKKQHPNAQQAQNEQEGFDEEQEMLEEQSGLTEQIIETGTVTPTKGKYVIHCLTIVGQVEGHYILPPQNKTTKYEHVIPQLVAIQENPDIQGLIMILNTVGGDVEAGLAIAELVSGMKKPTVSLVLGGGHSIGVPLAVSAKKSFIAPSATMTIHPVRMNGVVLGVPQTLSYFDKMQERIVRFVEQNSRISPDNFRKLMMNTGELVMDVGTVLDGAQAVEEGLIDNLGGLSEAINCLYDMIEEEIERNRDDEDAEDAGEEKRGRHKVAGIRPVPRSRRAGGKPRREPVRPTIQFSPSFAAGKGTDRAREARERRLNSAVAGTNTGGPQMHKMDQRSVMERDAAGQEKGAPAFNGGGEGCRVNPFGHPARDAD